MPERMSCVIDGSRHLSSRLEGSFGLLDLHPVIQTLPTTASCRRKRRLLGREASQARHCSARTPKCFLCNTNGRGIDMLVCRYRVLHRGVLQDQSAVVIRLNRYGHTPRGKYTWTAGIVSTCTD